MSRHTMATAIGAAAGLTAAVAVALLFAASAGGHTLAYWLLSPWWWS